MDRKELQCLVREILAKEWNLDLSQIPDNPRLGDFSSWDSMAHVQILMALQNEFEFPMTPQIVQELVSLEKIINFLDFELGVSTAIDKQKK